MTSIFSRPLPVRTGTGLIARSAVTVQAQQIVQTQYLSEHYVLTSVGSLLVLFWADRAQRFRVDRAREELKRIDVAAQLREVAEVRTSLGEMRVEREPCEERVAGRACTRLVVRNENAAIVLDGEIYCTRVPELAHTALARERELDTALQPFTPPLAPDEIAVRSTMRLLARGFEQNQQTELLGLEPDVAQFVEFDRILTFRVVD
ncbi:MAG: hypothetical protein KY464_16785 [Gemmatimonadetes bacterium]|nr:hypothetical protein [Gemmatimonadota bacterium]